MHGYRHLHRDPYRWVEMAALMLFGRAAHHAPAVRQSEFADPSVEACAVALAEEVWHEMNQRRMAGEPWYVARERALAPQLRDWRKRYGTPCAARAHEIVLGLDPARAPAAAREAEDWRVTEHLTVAIIKRKGKLTWLDKWSFRHGGIPFS